MTLSKKAQLKNRGENPFSRVRNIAEQILGLMWLGHQSFKSVILKEVATAEWMMYYTKLPGLKVVGGEIKEEGMLWQEYKRYVKELSRNLRNITVNVFKPQARHYTVSFFSIDNITLKIEGEAMKMMKELSNRLNVHWNFTSQIYDLRFKINRTPMHKISQRLALATWFGKVDFSPCKFTHDEITWTLMDIISASAREVTFIFIVPRSGPLPLWTLPMRVFPPVIWAALLGTALLYALAWRVVTRESLGASAAAALRAFSSCGGSPQDRVRVTTQRLQLAAVLLASGVVVIAVYEGRLFTLITNPEHYAEIDTFDDLADSGLPVYSPLAFSVRNMLSSDMGATLTPRTLKRLSNLRSEVVQTNDVALKVMDGERLAWLESTEAWDVYSSVVEIYRTMRPMRESYGFSMNVLHARPNWAWTDIVNLMYLRFQSAGLFDKWRANEARLEAIYGRQFLKWKRVSPGMSQDDPRELVLQDLIPYMHLLVAGLLLATITFFAEICRCKTKCDITHQ